MSDSTMVLLTGLLGTVMVTGLLASAIVGAYFFGRGRAPQDVRSSTADTNERRLARMEALLEQLATDVERVGESQRYVARLSAQSPSAHALPNASPERYSSSELAVPPPPQSLPIP